MINVKNIDATPFCPCDPFATPRPQSLRSKRGLLGERTQNIVIAEVIRIKKEEMDRLNFGFNLVAPAMSSYRVRLFIMSHGILNFYPVSMVSTIVRKNPKERFTEWHARDQDELLRDLRDIFYNERTVNLIRVLRAPKRRLSEPGRRNTVLAN